MDFRALLCRNCNEISANPREHTSALCSPKVQRHRGLFDFALPKSTDVQDFRTLLWLIPPAHWTFGLCSAEVHRRAGLSDFALAKSTGVLDFQTLLWRSPRARWTFGLRSAEVHQRGGLFDFALAKFTGVQDFPLPKSTGAEDFCALLCRSMSFALREGGCASLRPPDRRPRPSLLLKSDKFGGGGISPPGHKKSRPYGRRRRSYEYESEHAADAD